MYGLTGEPLQTLYKIVAIFILLGVQLMATARARVRYITVHMMAPNGPMMESLKPTRFLPPTRNGCDACVKDLLYGLAEFKGGRAGLHKLELL